MSHFQNERKLKSEEENIIFSLIIQIRDIFSMIFKHCDRRVIFLHEQTIFAFKMPSFYTYWFENRGVLIFGFVATKKQTRVWHFV